MSDDLHENCCNCGITFCLTRALYEARLSDHRLFYCPNGHAQAYTGKTEQEKRIESLESHIEFLSAANDELYARGEELIGVLKECPVPGCTYRSRKQVARDPVAMGRGIERVRADLFEHMVRDHTTRQTEARLLVAGESA